MLLVDTNVIVALLIENTPWRQQVRDLFERDPDWRSETHALVELSNVLTRYVRVGEFEATAAIAAMDAAQRRFSPGLYQAAPTDALRIALEFGISAYDARFLAAARGLGVKLVTEDAKLRRAAPELTQTIAQAVGA